MRQVSLLVFVLLLLFSAAALMGQCPAGDVDVHLNWCSGDHGFNEGATCGLNALGNTGLTGLPALAAQPILGNTWDRTNMMGATIVAYKAGYTKEAIDAAICCQIHTPGAHECLASHRDFVGQWLKSH
jgi:hypothetical protein